jgi:hypothetical protein
LARILRILPDMSAGASVSSNDSGLEAAVVAWLLSSRMALPAEFRIQLTVVDSVGTSNDPREAFCQGDTDIRAGEPLGWVHLTWRVAPAQARIEEDRPEAAIEVSREALEHLDSFLRSFLLVSLIFLWKRSGRYHVHAGSAIAPGGKGWMLIGDSGSGKSTTTALLAVRGWQVSTDDIAFLEARAGRAAVVGFRSPIALRPGGFALLGQAGGIPLPSRGKTGFWPEELGATWVQTVEPDIIVFTSVGGERTTLEPMSAGAVLAQLMQWSLWVLFEPTAAQEHLDLLAQLGRQAKCFRATIAPDLFAAPGALEDFLP